MAKFFVFLEITDPDVDALICGIRAMASSSPPKTAPHVTIRGPYNRPIPQPQLRRYEHLLLRDPVVLEGIGTFQVGERTTVYLKVQHPKLRQVWWKPDYPIGKFGFNPHVTLYEGHDAQRARQLAEFLKREGLKLLTWSFSVSAHVSDHKDMFPQAQCADSLFLGLVNRGVVRADVLARLARSLGVARQAA
jgi:hypothetical protein